MNYILLVLAVLAGLIVMVIGLGFAIRITVKIGWSVFKFVLAAAIVFVGGYLIYWIAGASENAVPVFLNMGHTIHAKAGAEYNVIFSDTTIDASQVPEGNMKVNCILSRAKVILPYGNPGAKIYNILSSVILPGGEKAILGPSDYEVQEGRAPLAFINSALGKTELVRG